MSGGQDLYLVYRSLIPKDDNINKVKTFKECFDRNLIFFVVNKLNLGTREMSQQL